MTVLVVDDDAVVAQYCRRMLSEAGHSVLVVTSGKDALAALDGREIDVVLSDVRMPGMNGVDLLRSISPGNTGPDVVLMTGFASISSAVEAIRLGAYDYLVKPFVPGQFEATIQRLAELRALRTENLVLRLQLDSERGIDGMVGGSPAMLGVFKAISRIAGKRQPVLITGETGTGKELVARAIHDQGPDKDRPFVAVDCGALSPEIVESEIFGHVRGAFTGAIGDRPGLLASAAHGTFSWMRWASFRWLCRRSSSGSSRTASSGPWAATPCAGLKGASSRLPAATWKRPSRRDASGRSCSSGCACIRFTCPHCGRGLATFRR